MTRRFALAAAASLMGAAVALGAFGAHALKSRVAPDLVVVWQTAVTYHAWHALGLLATGTLMLLLPERRLLGFAAWLFIGGIALFSGSLYAIALGAPAPLGIATPVGGVAFIAGWAMLAVALAHPYRNNG